MKKKISVIIPVHNIESYLEKCLISIIKQTYRELEIIIINDGSTDKSAQICEKFEQQDSRIIYISQINKGVSAVRNLGIETASGEWISFIDGDDYLEHDTYEMLMKCLELNPICDLISYSYIEESEKVNELENEQLFNSNIPVTDYVFYEGEQILNSIFSNPSISGLMCNKLFNTQLIKKNNLRLNEKISVCEDLLFCYHYFQISTAMIFINQNFYHYIQRKGSATIGKVDKRKITGLEVYEYLLKDSYGTKSIYRQICNAYVVLLIYLTKMAFLFGCEYSEIRTLLKENLKKYLPITLLNKNLKFKYKLIGCTLILFPGLYKINIQKDTYNGEKRSLW